MSDDNQPPMLNAAFKIREGMEGLHDLVGEAMELTAEPVGRAILRSVAAAYALGYNEAMAGKPAIVPGMVLNKDDLPD